MVYPVVMSCLKNTRGFNTCPLSPYTQVLTEVRISKTYYIRPKSNCKIGLTDQ